MSVSTVLRSARLAGLALIGVSMAIAPSLSAQSMARGGSPTQRPRVERSGPHGGRVDITAQRVPHSGV